VKIVVVNLCNAVSTFHSSGASLQRAEGNQKEHSGKHYGKRNEDSGFQIKLEEEVQQHETQLEGKKWPEPNFEKKS